MHVGLCEYNCYLASALILLTIYCLKEAKMWILKRCPANGGCLLPLAEEGREESPVFDLDIPLVCLHPEIFILLITLLGL